MKTVILSEDQHYFIKCVLEMESNRLKDQISYLHGQNQLDLELTLIEQRKKIEEVYDIFNQ